MKKEGNVGVQLLLWYQPAPTPGICFSERTEVEVLGKGSTRMDQLAVGDSVLNAGGSYSTVYSFGHRALHTKTPYLQVFATLMKPGRPLEIAPEHLIYVQKRHATENSIEIVPAEQLQVGDRLQTERGDWAEILWIRAVERQGAYAPLTETGNVVVNGVLASNYVARGWLKDRVPGGVLHFLQHGATVPLRLYCSMVANCREESHDPTTGFSAWVQFWYTIEQWQLSLPKIWQVLFLSVLAVPAVGLILLGNAMVMMSVDEWKWLATHLIAAVIGFSLWVQRKKKKRTVVVLATKTK